MLTSSYRKGCRALRACRVRHACGAVASGVGAALARVEGAIVADCVRCVCGRPADAAVAET